MIIYLQFSEDLKKLSSSVKVGRDRDQKNRDYGRKNKKTWNFEKTGTLYMVKNHESRSRPTLVFSFENKTKQTEISFSSLTSRVQF